VLPFRIENVSPEKNLRYYMGSVHWLDALTPPLEQHLERLVASVQALVRVGAGDGPIRDGSKSKTFKPPARIGWWHALAAVLVLAAIALGSFLYFPAAHTPVTNAVKPSVWATDDVCKNPAVFDRAKEDIITKHRGDVQTYTLTASQTRSDGTGACFISTWTGGYRFRVVGSCCGPGSSFDIQAVDY
jgi:hypothetical protein